MDYKPIFVSLGSFFVYRAMTIAAFEFLLLLYFLPIGLSVFLYFYFGSKNKDDGYWYAQIIVPFIPTFNYLLDFLASSRVYLMMINLLVMVFFLYYAKSKSDNRKSVSSLAISFAFGISFSMMFLGLILPFK